MVWSSGKRRRPKAFLETVKVEEEQLPSTNTYTSAPVSNHHRVCRRSLLQASVLLFFQFRPLSCQALGSSATILNPFSQSQKPGFPGSVQNQGCDQERRARARLGVGGRLPGTVVGLLLGLPGVEGFPGAPEGQVWRSEPQMA